MQVSGGAEGAAPPSNGAVFHLASHRMMPGEPMASGLLGVPRAGPLGDAGWTKREMMMGLKCGALQLPSGSLPRGLEYRVILLGLRCGCFAPLPWTVGTTRHTMLSQESFGPESSVYCHPTANVLGSLQCQLSLERCCHGRVSSATSCTSLIADWPSKLQLMICRLHNIFHADRSRNTSIVIPSSLC